MDQTHPLYRFSYCPLCGSSRFEPDGPNNRKCRDCGFSYYTNPRGATVALIINDREEILCGIRQNEPARGTRDLIGGFMDLDETAEEGMCREIMEESGLEVKPGQLRYLFSLPNRYEYSGITVRTIDLFFEVRIEGRPSFEGRDDIGALEWIPIKELKPEEFGLGSVRRGVERYLKAPTP